MAYKDITPPAGGKITIAHGKLSVPNNPSSLSFAATAPGRTSGRPARGSSTRRCRRLTAASAKSPGSRSLPARSAFKKFNNWLPDDTVEAFREYLVGIKGPLTTPVGGGIRSLNVALRQMLDLYVCLRPVQYFTRRALARQASGKGGHGHLPRKHRGHLRRHRIRGRLARGAESPRFPGQGSFPKGFDKIRFGTRRRRQEFLGGRAARKISVATCAWASASSRSVTAAACA